MQRRRFTGGLAVFGIVSAIGLSAAGCGSDSGGGGDVTLKLVAADYGTGDEDSSQDYWEDLARGFEKDNPGIKIDVNVLSWNEVDDRVAEMVKAGNPPDIAQTSSYADYAAADKLYSAAELLSIPTHADIVPALAQAGELSRVQYGLPFVSSTRVLFYNKKLFTEAGLDADKPPKNWTELKSAAEALKTAGVKYPYGLPLGPEEAQGEVMNWLLGGGGGYTDNVGTYSIDSPENVRTLNWLRENLVDEKLVGPGNPAKTDRADIFAAFGKGEVGILNGHPALIQTAEKGKIDYGTAPLPGREGPAGTAMGVADWIMGFKANGHRKEIGAFLDHVFETDQHYAFADRYGLLPVTTSASDEMASDKKNADLRPFLQELPAAEFYPVNKVSWKEINGQLRKTIGQAVIGPNDPGGMLGSIQRKAETAESAAAGRQH